MCRLQWSYVDQLLRPRNLAHLFVHIVYSMSFNVKTLILKYQYNKYMFNFIDRRGLIAQFFLGAINAVRTALLSRIFVLTKRFQSLSCLICNPPGI